MTSYQQRLLETYLTAHEAYTRARLTLDAAEENLTATHNAALESGLEGGPYYLVGAHGNYVAEVQNCSLVIRPVQRLDPLDQPALAA